VPQFADNLAFGQIGESAIARWLRRRGSSVLPAYEKEINSGKGPRLFTPDAQLVTPDLFIFPWLEFIEAKHKSVFTWYHRSRKWCTGIDLHHYRDYLKTQQQTKRRVWLLFLHRFSGILPDGGLDYWGYPMSYPYRPTDTDLGLEQRLKDTLQRIDEAHRPETKSTLWLKYQSLHRQRSPGYVAWMENKLRINR